MHTTRLSLSCLKSPLFALGISLSLSIIPSLRAEVASADLTNVMNFSAAQDNAIGAPAIGTDGSIYIAVGQNGSGDAGSIQRVSTTGQITKIYSFTGSLAGDDGPPVTPLTLGADGALYGATEFTFFKVTTNGIFTTLARFTAAQGDTPVGNVLVTADGTLYAATSVGGATQDGTLLKWTAADGISVLATFDGTVAGGASRPDSGLCEDTSGNLYGTSEVSDGNQEMLYQYSPAGGLTQFALFDPTVEGFTRNANGNVVYGPNGNFYVATAIGEYPNSESNFDGAIVSVTPGGVITVLHLFSEVEGSPLSDPVFGPDGALYGLAGSTVNGNAVFYRLTVDQQYTKLNTFDSSTGIVINNEGGLARDAAGNFVAAASAEVGYNPNGGLIFTLQRADGTSALLATLAYFSPNGSSPNADLALAPDGGVYGSTGAGGRYGQGTLFHVSSSVAENLYDFTDGDPNTPIEGLVLGRDGAYYGVDGDSTAIFRYVAGSGSVAVFGDIIDDLGLGLNLPTPLPAGGFLATDSIGGSSSRGALYNFSAAGQGTILSSFDAIGQEVTGERPEGRLILAADGDYYGYVQSDGLDDGGAIYKTTPNGQIHQVAKLDPITVGAPVGSLVQASDGNFYGMTSSGDSDTNAGTLFRMTPAGVVTVLVNFDGTTQGNYPNSGLTIGADGLLYGATGENGPNGGGCLFQSTLDGKITVLAAFDSEQNGDNAGTVFQAADHTLYVALADDGPGEEGALVHYTGALPVPIASPAPGPVDSGTPPAAPKVNGKPKQKTDQSKITITGKLGTIGSYVEYKIGNGKYVKAKGGAAWKCVVKLKPGKNTIFIVSVDPVTGKKSTAKKVVVTRS